RWHTEKGAHNISIADKHKLAISKKIQDAEMLTGAHTRYTLCTENVTEVSYASRWRVLFMLKRLVDEVKNQKLGISPKLLAGRDSALYEQMFRAEPQEFISKPAFLTVMRRGYGFNIAPIKGLGHRKAQRILTEVYDKFDVKQKDKVNWRTFLFMLRVIADSHVTVDNHLCWGFALHSSSGSFDITSEDPVRM
ncbi:unnamed protein product, partial [Choristocarpus tenellus]